MDVNIISQFISGRSGAKVYLAEKNGIVGVYKTNINNALNVIELSKRIPFPQPEVYDYDSNSIFMEYIKGSRIRDVLHGNSATVVSEISDYVLSYIDFCLSTSMGMHDFSDSINDKIIDLKDNVDASYFKYAPTIHPLTIAHGDFTFDNLIYKNGKIYMIDFSPNNFTSLHFDMNKFRQDLSGLWFVRNEPNKELWRPACDKIYENIEFYHPDIFHDHLYNLMISRILPYCKGNNFDYNYVLGMLK